MGGRVKIVWTLSFFVLLTRKSLSFLLEKLSLSTKMLCLPDLAGNALKILALNCVINTTPKTKIPAVNKPNAYGVFSVPRMPAVQIDYK
jgi:hypothetical protein